MISLKPMKKVILFIFLLLILTACKGYEVTEIAKSTEQIQEEEIIEEKINTEKQDPNFNLPADEDTEGWTQTLGPVGGVVLKMIPYEDTIWASLYSGGIYELKKDNSWKQIGIGHGLPEVRAFDIVTNEDNTNIVYVPERIACAAKTIDSGSSWKGLCSKILTDIGADNFNSNTLAIDPKDSKTIYIPGYTHDQISMVIISKDGGENWEKLSVFDQQYDFNDIIFFNSKIYLATIENGILVSEDKGKTWTELNTGLKGMNTARFVAFKDDLYLLGSLLQYNVRLGGQLYRLSEDASSWEKNSEVNEVTGLGANDTALFVGTMDPSPRLWISTDGNSFEVQETQGLSDWIGEILSL
ncbi:MAG: hypothetical protein Q8R18_00330, partial [bacterium]|nr:hypothetical protein [bacterium]